MSDLLLDLELSHCFRSQGSSWAQLISVVFPLVDQNVMSHLELIISPFAVAKCLRQCLFVIQRTVDKVQIRSHFSNPALHLDSILAFQSDLVEVRNI